MNRAAVPGGGPAYLQLYTQLRQDIVSLAYPYGARLPSKRTLASETGVSVVTAEHAIALLCEEGYAETRERSGTFVIYRSSDFSAMSPAEQGTLPGPAALQAGRTGDFPFSVLARTMRKVLLDYGEQLLVRPPNRGSEVLRGEICAYLARSRGMRVDPEQIVIGAGAEYLYGLIGQLLGAEHIFAIEDPSYEKIRRVYTALGIPYELLPLTSDGIPTASLERTAATVLHVTPFHSFPSGVSAGISKKLEYLHWAVSRGGWLIEDNYDSELTVSRKAEDALFAMTDTPCVIYLNTFSRTVAPSMRAGYMILPEPLLAEYNTRLSFYSCTVPLFEQYVLAELLRSGDFERHINRVRRARRRLERQNGRE